MKNITYLGTFFVYQELQKPENLSVQKIALIIEFLVAIGGGNTMLR